MSSPYIFFGYGTAFWEDGKWLISCLVKGERSQIPVIFPVQEKYKPKTKMKTRCPRSHSIFKKEMPNLPRKTIIHTRSFHCFPLFKALRKGWFFFWETDICAWGLCLCLDLQALDRIWSVDVGTVELSATNWTFLGMTTWGVYGTYGGGPRLDWSLW